MPALCLQVWTVLSIIPSSNFCTSVAGITFAQRQAAAFSYVLILTNGRHQAQSQIAV